MVPQSAANVEFAAAVLDAIRFAPIDQRRVSSHDPRKSNQEETMTGLGRRRVLQGLGATGALCLTAVHAKGAPAPTLVTATFGPAGAIYAANMVADVLGFAKQQALEIKLQISDGGAKSRQILAAGAAIPAIPCR
jgi:hypothetical protein